MRFYALHQFEEKSSQAVNDKSRLPLQNRINNLLSHLLMMKTDTLTTRRRILEKGSKGKTSAFLRPRGTLKSLPRRPLLREAS